MKSLMMGLRLELRRACRDPALAALLVFFTIVSVYAAWNGREWASDRQAALDSIARQEQSEQDISLARVRQAATSGRGSAFDAAGLAAGLWNRPTLPLRPLAFMARGQAEGYPFDARFHVMTPQHTIFERAAADLGNPAAAAAGSFDLALVVVYLLPLLLLAASYDLWAQEHETGTSLMVMSQPTSPASVLAARILARGGALLLATTAVFIVILSVTTGGRSVVEVGAAAAILLLYGCFWLLIAVLVNVFAKRSAVAAIACLIAWLSFVLLIPALLVTSIDLVRPAPPHAELVNSLRLQALETPKSAGDAKLDRAGRLQREIAQAVTRDEQLRPLVRHYDDIATKRRDLAELLRVVSPAVVTQDAFERLAGTDAGRAMAFRSQSIAFQNVLRSFVRDDRPAQLEMLETAIDRVPRFRFDEPHSLRELSVDLFVSFAWAAAVCCVIVFALRLNTVNFSSRSPEIA